MGFPLNLARRVAQFGAWIGGFLVIAAALLTVAEIIIRKTTNYSLGGTSALSGYLLACSSAWAFGLALIDRAHLRVDLFYFQAPSWLRAVLNVLALAALTVFIFFLVIQAWGVFYQSYQFSSRDLTPLRVYLEYPQFIWFSGLAFFFLISLMLLAIAIKAVVTGDSDTLNRVAAPVSADDELQILRDDAKNADT